VSLNVVEILTAKLVKILEPQSLKLSGWITRFRTYGALLGWRLLNYHSCGHLRRPCSITSLYWRPYGLPYNGLLYVDQFVGLKGEAPVGVGEDVADGRGRVRPAKYHYKHVFYVCRLVLFP